MSERFFLASDMPFRELSAESGIYPCDSIKKD